MFEEEAKEYCTQQEFSKDVRDNIYNAFKDGAEFGFQKGIKAKLNITTISDCPIIWHKVADGDYPPCEKGNYTINVLTDKGDIAYYSYNYDCWVAEPSSGEIDPPIAWCEIPKFEENI